MAHVQRVASAEGYVLMRVSVRGNELSIRRAWKEMLGVP